MPYATAADVKLEMPWFETDSTYDTGFVTGLIGRVEARVDGYLRGAGFAVPLTNSDDVLVMKSIVLNYVADQLQSIANNGLGDKERRAEAEDTLQDILQGRLRLSIPRSSRIYSVGEEEEDDG